jgi:DNA-directed RNA polymerase subunit beta'
MPQYRNVRVEPTEEAKAAVYSVGSYDDGGEYAFGQGSGEAVPLEEYDFGQYNR